jgi:hypothetical protein
MPISFARGRGDGGKRIRYSAKAGEGTGPLGAEYTGMLVSVDLLRTVELRFALQSDEVRI